MLPKLRTHRLPVVSGLYPKKGQRALASHVLPGTKKLVLGCHGGLTEILYAATGFLLVRRQVYVEIQRQAELPVCNQRFDKAVIPFFQPMVRPDEDGQWYLAEDYAFCERARRCGFKIWADTSIRLGHIGKYSYTWEDVGRDKVHFSTYRFHFCSSGDKGRPHSDTSDESESASPDSGAGPSVAGLSDGQPTVRDGLPNRYLPYHFPGGRIFVNVAQSRKAIAQALGLHDPHQTRFLSTVLKPGMTFLDVLLQHVAPDVGSIETRQPSTCLDGPMEEIV